MSGPEAHCDRRRRCCRTRGGARTCRQLAARARRRRARRARASSSGTGRSLLPSRSVSVKSHSFELADLASRALARLFTLDARRCASTSPTAPRIHSASGACSSTTRCCSRAAPCHRPAVPGALTFRGPADMRADRATSSTRIDRGLRRRASSSPCRAALSGSLPGVRARADVRRPRRRQRGLDGVRIVLVTPEDEPLLLFGGAATRCSPHALLGERHVALHTRPTPARGPRRGAAPASSSRDRGRLRDRGCRPLRGQPIDGVPQTRDGFIVVDAHGRVRGSRTCTRRGTSRSSRSNRAGSRRSRRTPLPSRSLPTRVSSTIQRRSGRSSAGSF